MHLSFRGKLADFIEKNRARVCQLKTTLSKLQGTGKCPFLVTNNSDAISEGGIAAQLTLMKAWPARCEPYVWRAQSVPSRFLFRRNQHRRVGGSDFHDAERTVSRRARAHDLLNMKT